MHYYHVFGFHTYVSSLQSLDLFSLKCICKFPDMMGIRFHYCYLVNLIKEKMLQTINSPMVLSLQVL
jgi:hypothetical protein